MLTLRIYQKLKHAQALENRLAHRNSKFYAVYHAEEATRAKSNFSYRYNDIFNTHIDSLIKNISQYLKEKNLG